MKINPKDIEVSLVKADREQNLGSWSLQQYSGVILFHRPIKIRVSCTEYKSQWENKAEAMKMLESRLKNIDTDKLLFIFDELAKLKSSLGSYEGLTLEDYDILYGDIENIQSLLLR